MATHNVQDEIINIIICPGSGIRKPPTTKLCLNWLEQNIVLDEKILDFGSGSGILSISSKIFGAGYVLGVDIDDLAVDNALKLNGLNIPFINVKSFSTDQFFDTVIANILSSTLINLSPVFKAVTKRRLVLAAYLINRLIK